MRHLKDALETAIRELGHRDQNVIERMLETIEKLADSLRPSVKQAVTPVDGSARTMTIGTPGFETSFVVGHAEKQAINDEIKGQLDIEKMYLGIVTELDVETGSCKISLGHNKDNDERIGGKVTDPAVKIPNNLYALSLAQQTPIKFRAKAVLKDGDIEKLYISDTSN